MRHRGPMRFHWRLARVLLGPVFRFVLGVRVRGLEHVPLKGSVILAPNHRSSWDPPMVGYAAPREVFFLAKRELFDSPTPWGRLFSWVIRTWNALPVDRASGGVAALRRSLKLLQAGNAVTIFPEGTRNRTRYPLLPLQRGVVFLAYKANVPVVPVWLVNMKAPLWKWIFRVAPPEVRFGPPLRVEPGEDVDSFVVRLAGAMIALADPEDRKKFEEAKQKGYYPFIDGFEAKTNKTKTKQEV